MTSSDVFPLPRLRPDASSVVWVDAYTDFKLHDICGPGEGERIDQNQVHHLHYYSNYSQEQSMVVVYYFG